MNSNTSTSEKITKTEAPCKYRTARYKNVAYNSGEVTFPIPAIEDSELLYANTENLYPLDLRHKIQLARLLIDANIVSEEDISVLIDIAAINCLPLSETVCVFSVLTPHVRNLCDELLREVESNDLSYEMAVIAANNIYFTGCSLLEAHALIGSCRKSWSMLELLEAAGMISERDVDEVAMLVTDSASITGLMIERKILDERVLQIATRLRYLLKNGEISLAQAVVAVRSCSRAAVDVDDFLVDQGWKADRSPPIVPTVLPLMPLSVVA